MRAARRYIDSIQFDGYVATPTQGAFIGDRTRTRVLCGGLGSGKTLGGAVASLVAAVENQGRADGMIVAPTFPALVRYTMPAWELVARDIIKRKHKTLRYYELTTGDRVWWGTADVASSLEGTNLGWFWGDEIRYWPRQSWINMTARTRVAGAHVRRIATSSPDMGWMMQEFASGKANHRLFQISTRENAENLEDGYIDDLLTTMSPRMARALVDGEFVALEGSVYGDEYDPQRNVIRWDFSPRFKTWLFIDFGYQRPAIIIAQQIGDVPWYDGRRDRRFPAQSVIVFDEMMPDATPTERWLPQLCERLGGKLEGGVYQRGDSGVRIDRIACDPAGKQRDQGTGKNSVAMLERAFGPVVDYLTGDRDSDIPAGVDRVRSALMPASGDPPRLYFDERIAGPDASNASYRGIGKSIVSYHYPTMRDGRPRGDHPVKDGVFDHACDALRYGIINAQPLDEDQGGRVLRYTWGGED